MRLMMMEVPLCPLWVPGEDGPRTSKRQRPADSLNLAGLCDAIAPNTVGFLPAGGGRWSVTAALSPYSADRHVMVMESSPRLYRPGPERVPDAEGEAVVGLWAALVESMRAASPDACVNLGYNWSARSWGEPEERTGFASIPTKWHAQVWTWPTEPREPHARWADASEINAMERRLIVENVHGAPMGRLFIERILARRPGGDAFRRLFSAADPAADCRGALFRSVLPLEAILREAGLFTGVIKPLAQLLGELLKELTECMTDMDCGAIDARLARIESGGSDLAALLDTLRARPAMRPEDKMRAAMRRRGYDGDLAAALIEPVRLRCREEGDWLSWWRKGFGYALVFRGAPAGGTELRIMPGLYLGVGGVVEALGVALRRPEDRSLPEDIVRAKGRGVCELSRQLAGKVKGYVSSVG
jgi:hypothetical protein